MPIFASADTIISAPISTDTTWTPDAGVYVIDSNFRVEPGVTLTIAPGTIIKGRTTSQSVPSIFGRLTALGTAENPIYFTSFYDDTIGGDTDLSGPSTDSPGSWQGIYLKQNAVADFDYVNFKNAGYGGFSYGNFVGIENDGGTLNIDHSNFIDNYTLRFDWSIGHHRVGFAVRNVSGSLNIKNSLIASSSHGIIIESGTSTISNNQIENNSDKGIIAGGEGTLTLLNNTFDGNRGTAQINTDKAFIHSGNTSNDLYDRGYEMSGTIFKDTTLEGTDLPIILRGGITVDSGKTLTILPGTVIKLGGNGHGAIYVNGGRLIAEGTKEKPIYFTSGKDDTLFGDTNGDGTNTTPGPRNWNALYFENGSEVSFDHVVVRYGGYNYNGEYLPGIWTAIYDRGANFNITNSLFEKNYGTAIYKDAGTLNIERGEFIGTNSGDYGIFSRGGTINVHNSSFYGHLSDAILNQSGQNIGYWYQTRPFELIDARNNWWGAPDGPRNIATTTPSGSGDPIGLHVLYTPFLTSDPLLAQPGPDPVLIIPGIMGSAYKNGNLVIDPILHTYDDLIATLDENGYTPDVDLFTFPYEWRDSNVLSAAFLRNKINEVQEICQCEKVDLVAHSMGGLVARQYIQSNHYGNDVDQLIFLGTPHKGSPKSYLQWEAGQNDTDIRSQITSTFFTAEALKNGHLTIFDYIHNRPITSVQELLPTFDYLKDKDTGIIRTYPNNYPQNTFLENLNNNVSTLLNSGIKVTNIVGNSRENKTINTIRVIPTTSPKFWQHGEPDGFITVIGDNGLERGAGDNTVTTHGATLDSSITNENSNSSHNRIPTVEANEIYKILTGKDSTTNIDNGPNLSGSVLLLQLLSPIDFVITAPDGKKIGKNFSNNTEYNEIPEAFYSGFETDQEYITILNPQNGEYKIETQGTGNGGSYGILTSYITDTKTNTIEVTGTTLPNEITKFKVNVIDSNTDPIDIDLDNPTNNTITISSPESKDYLRSEKINISASTKIGTLSLSLISNPIVSGTLFDPFYTKLGTTTLFATSSIGTKAVATSSTTFRIVANYGSTISDIERAYSLGWIYSLDTKNQLINRVSKAIIGEEKIDSLETQKAGTKKITKIIEKLTKKIDRQLLKALKIDLEAYRKDRLNDRAYNIIKEDLDWLILNN